MYDLSKVIIIEVYTLTLETFLHLRNNPLVTTETLITEFYITYRTHRT